MVVEYTLRNRETVLRPDVVNILPELVAVDIDLAPICWHSTIRVRSRVGEREADWDVVPLWEIQIKLRAVEVDSCGA